MKTRNIIVGKDMFGYNVFVSGTSLLENPIKDSEKIEDVQRIAARARDVLEYYNLEKPATISDNRIFVGEFEVNSTKSYDKFAVLNIVDNVRQILVEEKKFKRNFRHWWKDY